MSDWDRPGFVEGFCEALARRIAKLEVDKLTLAAFEAEIAKLGDRVALLEEHAEASMKNDSDAIRLGHQREALEHAIERWKRIEEAARELCFGSTWGVKRADDMMKLREALKP